MDGTESESDTDLEEGETADDTDIKEAMADVMYICCQRPEKRMEMLKKLKKDQVKSICQCAEGILKGDIPINYAEKDHMKEHADVTERFKEDYKRKERNHRTEWWEFPTEPHPNGCGCPGFHVPIKHCELNT